MKMPTQQSNYIDLFSGCGGLSLGLRLAGWRGLFAIEKDPMAFATLKHNLVSTPSHFDWPDWLPLRPHDVDAVLADHRDDLRLLRNTVDLVAGGPPCQGFSTAGSRNETDNRNRLVHSYLEFIELVRPKIVFFENVRGFTIGFTNGKGRSMPYSDIVIHALRALGYDDVTGQLVDFSDFGVPQRRKRFIIVATQFGLAPTFFAKLSKEASSFLRARGLRTRIGIRTAISDLERTQGESPTGDRLRFMSGRYGRPRNNYQSLLRAGSSRVMPDSHSFARHSTSTVAIFDDLLRRAERDHKILGEERKAYGVRKRSVTVLDPLRRCPTLTSHPDDYVHYSESRILTVRECARIQTFPDTFEFKGKYTTGGHLRIKEVPRYTQVGNAIPPLFAEISGRVLKGFLTGD